MTVEYADRRKEEERKSLIINDVYINEATNFNLHAQH